MRAAAAGLRRPAPPAWWSSPLDDVVASVESRRSGLTTAEAQERLLRDGRNELVERRAVTRLTVLWNQLRSPLLLLLVFAAIASALTADWADAVVVLLIVAASTGIGYAREYRAEMAAADLRARVRTHTTVLRDGAETSVPIEEIVAGDVVLLSAGSIVPADALLIETTDFFVNEAVLTGESFPVAKKAGPVAADATLKERTGSVFLGTNVRSGTARCVVVATGRATEYGAIAHRLMLRPPETEFDRGLRHFGYLLTTAMFVIVVVVFAVNVMLHRPAIETLLFSIALAVGLSPELLPAILSVNLARGAQMMSHDGVLVRRLNAIENLGSMDVLCTDKTGTLTEGVVRLEGAYDWRGERSDAVLALAALNARLQSGLVNPLDEAILQARPNDSSAEKIGEIPYDFVRKRLSVIVREGDAIRLVAKGAFEQTLAECTKTADGGVPLDADAREALAERFRTWSSEGTRVLAVATREMPSQQAYSRDDERELTFEGFLTFLDHPKADIVGAVTDLRQLGVALKLITGDAKLVAQYVAGVVGLDAQRVLTGRDLDELHDEALWHAAERTDIFAEVDPNQKERIILSLRKMGHVVGFLGDGINDAPAMHAADTSISVQRAVDVAREAADFVLLESHLDVIRRGVEEGRKTFANTLKYVMTTMSANLGNMISMAVASLFLPFLPLLAGQVLLNNFLSDVPAIGLAGDAVDPEMVDQPRRWNMRFIGRFMIEFGVLSSIFDIITFAMLLGIFAATPELFRTGWFVESLLTELVIALVVRTRRPFFRSRPGALLLWTTVAVIALTFAIPYLPFAAVLGFTSMPPVLAAALVLITILYVGSAELLKPHFYREAAVTPLTHRA